jgi:hypothetical protein
MRNYSFFLAIVLLICSKSSYGQKHIECSKKHIEKINRVKESKEKLSLYRKFYKKDSTREAKQLDRRYQLQIDSMADVVANREKALEERGKKVKADAKSKVFNRVYKPWAKIQAWHQLNWLELHGITITANAKLILLKYLENYFLSATQNDASIAVLKQKMPGLKLPKTLQSKVERYNILEGHNLNTIKGTGQNKLAGNRYIRKASVVKGKGGRYKSEADKYVGYSQVLSSSDSVKDFVQAKGEDLAMKQAVSRVEGLGELTEAEAEIGKLQGMPGGYQSHAEQMQDSTYLKDQAKRKAEELAMKYVSEHPELLQGVQAKMSVLMKKYSVIPNSNDMGTAIKRNSLQGKSFRERLYFTGNFQLVSLDPISIDFSPALGYRFNRKLIAGIGGNYRQSFSDSLPLIAPQVIGYKAFTNYDLVKDFFLYGEFDRNSPGMRKTETNIKRTWKNAAFIGVGRKFSIHPKVEMTAIFMYNLLYEYNDPIYPKRWSFKIGFQTTELAMFKKPKATFK